MEDELGAQLILDIVHGGADDVHQRARFNNHAHAVLLDLLLELLPLPLSLLFSLLCLLRTAALTLLPFLLPLPRGLLFRR